MNRAKLKCPDLAHITLIGRVDCGLDSGLIAETSASWPTVNYHWTLDPEPRCVYIHSLAQVATRFASAFLSSSRAVSPTASLPSVGRIGDLVTLKGWVVADGERWMEAVKST
jgi:hypothetical protein